MCIYIYINKQYTLCKQKLLFWMWLILINRLTALIILYCCFFIILLHCCLVLWLCFKGCLSSWIRDTRVCLWKLKVDVVLKQFWCNSTCWICAGQMKSWTLKHTQLRLFNKLILFIITSSPASALHWLFPQSTSWLTEDCYYSFEYFGHQETLFLLTGFEF